MQRLPSAPRSSFQVKNQSIGLTWQSNWDETARWNLSPSDVQRLTDTAKEAHEIVLETVGVVIRDRQLPLFGYTDSMIDLITQSWDNRGLSFLQRFDLADDGTQSKVLSFNAESPQGIFETAVVQKSWLQEAAAGLGQFNELDSQLRAQFRQFSLLDRTTPYTDGIPPLHISALPDGAEAGNAQYLARIACESGVDARYIDLDQIGTLDDGDTEIFVDMDNVEIERLMKLAYLDDMIADPFGQTLAGKALDDDISIIEGAWSILASNKRLLASMWERYPYHPILLNTATTQSGLIGGYAKKPISGHWGQNITLVDSTGATIAQTGGTYGTDQFIFQELASLANADGNNAVFSVWMMNGNPVALSVNESTNAIVGDDARFVPHTVG